MELARKRANYNDHGAAIRRCDIWDPIPSTGLAELTIEDAQTHLFHIVPPHKKVDNTNPRVFRYIPPDAWKIRELYRCVMSVDHRRSVIHRLHGYGAPLLIDCGPEHGDITPARKFRMLLHINPTRQRGKRTGSLARASGWYMTFFAAGVILACI